MPITRASSPASNGGAHTFARRSAGEHQGSAAAAHPRRITDPHNLGAIMRSADAFGVHASSRRKTTRRHQCHGGKSRLGAAETVPYIMVTNLSRTIEELKEHNIWVIATDMDGEQPCPKSTSDRHRLGAGRRGDGHPPPGQAKLRSGRAHSHRRTVESLNVSVSRRCVCMRRRDSAGREPFHYVASDRPGVLITRQV